MIVNLVIWLGLAIITVLMGWLAWRAWRAKRWYVKWPGVVLSGLLTLILAVLTVLSGIGFYRFYTPRGSPVEPLQVAGTPEQIARGEHLARIECVDCHTTNGELPLSGGRNLGDEIPVPLGDFYSINLTPGGPLKDWTDGEIMRTLKEGVDREGRPLLVMSANTVRFLNEEDQQAIIAYLRSQPAVVNDTPHPPDQPTLLAAVMTGAGQITFQPSVKIASIPKAPTVEYGEYVLGWTNCARCHGENLGGGTGGTAALPSPKGPPLWVVQSWSVDQFMTTMRTGVDPSSHELTDEMPWRIYGQLDDDELGAIYAYIQTLTPGQ